LFVFLIEKKKENPHRFCIQIEQTKKMKSLVFIFLSKKYTDLISWFLNTRKTNEILD